MIICPDPGCNKENAEGSNFCIHCGKEIPQQSALTNAVFPSKPETQETAPKKETDSIESTCCGIAMFIGIIGAIGGFLQGKGGGEIGYWLGGMFFMTWIVIFFLQGLRWIYRKITNTS